MTAEYSKELLVWWDGASMHTVSVQASLLCTSLLCFSAFYCLYLIFSCLFLRPQNKQTWVGKVGAQIRWIKRSHGRMMVISDVLYFWLKIAVDQEKGNSTIFNNINCYYFKANVGL